MQPIAWFHLTLIRFNLATESYGGHYGPEFATYFEQQNALIASGSLPGAVTINLYALIINKFVVSSHFDHHERLTCAGCDSGWIDPLIQNKGYVDFAANAPGYGPLVSASTVTTMNNTFYKSGGCLAQQQSCYSFGDTTSSAANKACTNADNYCVCILAYRVLSVRCVRTDEHLGSGTTLGLLRSVTAILMT